MITPTNFINDNVQMFLDDIIDKHYPKDSARPRPEKGIRQELMSKYWTGNLIFKSFFQRDNKSNYCIIDRKHTLKCVFNAKYLNECFKKETFALLNKNKNLTIDVKLGKIDIMFCKQNEKVLHSTIVILVDKFNLQIAKNDISKKVRYKQKDINLEDGIDYKLKVILNIMKKNNINRINDKNTIGKSWMFSDIPFCDVVEINNITFNNKNEIEIVGIKKDKNIKIIDYNDNNKKKVILNFKIEEDKENKGENNNINFEGNNITKLKDNKDNFIMNKKRKREEDNEFNDKYREIGNNNNKKISKEDINFNNKNNEEEDDLFFGDEDKYFFDFDF